MSDIEIELSADHMKVLKDAVDVNALLVEQESKEDIAKLKTLLKTGRTDVRTLKLLKKHHSLHGLWIHELLKDANVVLPSPPEEPPRNPELEARIQRLKAEQANRDYRRMTANVDPSQNYGQTPTFSTDPNFRQEMRGVSRHLTVVLNTLVTVLGAFFFAFKGIDLALPGTVPFETRLALGMVMATGVFFADLYFIVKYMDS